MTLRGAPTYDLTEQSNPACGRVVVIGASAGGIAALIALLSGLPSDFPLPILVVQHLEPTRESQLAAVLGWRTRLDVRWAEEGDRLMPATVYLARPDHHLVIRPGGEIALSRTDRVGWWRPAVDVLFRSAAEVYGPGAIAIVLSGMMWDGAEGTAAVAKAGGITIAQDETTSEFFEMPAAALDIGHADIMLRPEKIAEALQILTEAASA